MLSVAAKCIVALTAVGILCLIAMQAENSRQALALTVLGAWYVLPFVGALALLRTFPRQAAGHRWLNTSICIWSACAAYVAIDSVAIHPRSTSAMGLVVLPLILWLLLGFIYLICHNATRANTSSRSKE